MNAIQGQGRRPIGPDLSAPHPGEPDGSFGVSRPDDDQRDGNGGRPAIMADGDTGRGDPMADRDVRVRRRAYDIWLREGRPEGRAEEHWERASEEIAIEDNLEQTLLPNPSHGPMDTAERTEPVEPVLSMESLGETPGLEDQGKAFQIPGDGERAPVPEPSTAGEAAPEGARAATSQEAAARRKPSARKARADDPAAASQAEDAGPAGRPRRKSAG